MDWSAVFDDVGEGEGDWDREEMQGDKSHRLILQIFGPPAADGRTAYTPLICYAFTVNYILGVGCLGIPYAFQQCGLVLGTALVVLLSYVTYITVMWVALAAQREMQWTQYLTSSNPFLLSPASSRLGGYNQSKHSSVAPAVEPEGQQTPLLSSAVSLSNLYSSFRDFIVQDSTDRTTALDPTYNNRKLVDSSRRTHPRSSEAIGEEGVELEGELEVIDLVHKYLGPYGSATYQGGLMMLTYVGLLAYAQVFNSSFNSQVWRTPSMHASPLLFAAIVVPLSCCDLSEQITVQVLMSLLRFLSLGILLFGTMVAIAVDDAPRAVVSGPPLFQPTGFGVMFTTAIFSQLFQHSVPGLIRPLAPEHKKFVPAIFRYAILTTCLVYVSTGCVCTYYFGARLQQSVNLNFVDFAWGVDRANQSVFAAVSAVSMVVVLFPAMDTLSVFPLIANTLGNNLHASFPALGTCLKASGVFTHPGSLKRATSVAWRLIASVPPIVMSMYVSDLMLSLQVAGLCGIVVALVAPALLQRHSEVRTGLLPASIKAAGPIPSAFNHRLYSSAVLLIAFVALLISIVQMLAS